VSDPVSRTVQVSEQGEPLGWDTFAGNQPTKPNADKVGACALSPVGVGCTAGC
jgi:hypothetical protein